MHLAYPPLCVLCSRGEDPLASEGDSYESSFVVSDDSEEEGLLDEEAESASEDDD